MLISYAQNFEDVILWRALQHVKNGVYVDVGAQDPMCDSVSLVFYERGWRGIHIEPVEVFARRLREARPEEEVIEAAVGTEPNSIVFYKVGETGLSTSDSAMAGQYEAQGLPIERFVVPCVPLSAILSRFEGRELHWLKIDVEGMERAVIDSWSPSSVRPWVVVVESTRPNTSEPNFQEWEPKLLTLGYEFVYFDGLNRFYVSNLQRDLRAAFGSGPNYFDNFSITKFSPFARGLAAQLHEASVSLDARNGEVAKLQSEAAASELERDRMAAAHVDLVREVQTIRADLENRDQTLASLKSRIDELQSKNDELISSASWRLTRPLRAVEEGIRCVTPRFPGGRVWEAGRKVVAAVGATDLGSRFFQTIARSLLTPFWEIAKRLRSILLSNTPGNDFVGAQSYVANNPQGLDVFATPLAAGQRTLYLFVDHTVACPTNTGVQRVTRAIASGLAQSGERVRFVKWDVDTNQCVLINSAERESLAQWNGPATSEQEYSIYNSSIEPHTVVGHHLREENNWLIVPEVTHITYQPQPITLDLVCWARRHGLKAGFVFYDAIPLRRDEFADMAEKHRKYMQQLRLSDEVWPISRTSSDDLVAFWAAHDRADGATIPELVTLPLAGGFGMQGRSVVPQKHEKLILCVGTIEPRKNQVQLIHAFQDYRKRNPDSPWRLTLVGNLHPLVRDEVINATQTDCAIRHLGHVSDEELHGLYGICAFTVFPSIDEGFGLPILESLWHGKPCICANFGAMAEVAEGGGCLTTDTRNAVALGEAIECLISDDDLRSRLQEQAACRPLKSWIDYTSSIRDRIDAAAEIHRRVGPIYYWVDSTLTFSKNTGIQRVTRQLARELMSVGLPLIPIKWDRKTERFCRVSRDELAYLAQWNGPSPDQWQDWAAPRSKSENGWFIMPELPLNLSTGEQRMLLKIARSMGLQSAAIFFDAVPWKLREGYPEFYPKHLSSAHREYMTVLSEYDLVLPISEFSRADLIAFFGAVLEKPQGLESRIVAAGLPGEFPESPRVTERPPRIGSETITVLCVGTVEPRKNHATLIDAFLRASGSDSVQLRLVIAGRRTDAGLANRIQALIAENPSITWEENADDLRLRELYSACDFTVYPSVEEGFGLPIVESLWYAKPNICANFGAMAEVAQGGGCLMVDVRDIEALATAIQTLAEDSSLVETLSLEAIARPFKSWRDYAQEIVFRLARATPARRSKALPLSDADIRSRAQAMRLPRRPKLSVCITTYNRAAWLSANLRNWERLYPEPLLDVEFLVCDNSSTDHTPAVVKPYLRRPDFAYRRNPINVGMLGNLRETANFANGDYIWILGDDDLIMPGAIEHILMCIRKEQGVSLVYLNYAYTRNADAETISSFDDFFRNAIPIVPAEPDRAGKIHTICARNENFFTAIYTIVFRRDHAINAYSQDTSGRPFSTMLTCIPTTHYVLNQMMDEVGVWIGSPQVVINMNVSWREYAPLWILERIPEVYEVAESKGVRAEDIDRWRNHSMPGVFHYFGEIYRTDPLNNAIYFSPARLIRRFKHLPEFGKRIHELRSVYERAHRSGHAAAALPVSAVFS